MHAMIGMYIHYVIVYAETSFSVTSSRISAESSLATSHSMGWEAQTYHDVSGRSASASA